MEVKKSNQSTVRIGVGVIVYQKQSGSILLSIRKDCNMVALPGGHLELFEEIGECASRELYEETNLQIEPSKIIIYDSMNIIRKQINYHYINYFTLTPYLNSHIKQQIKNLEPHKHEDWEWVDEEKLQIFYDKSMLFYGLNDMIQKRFKGSVKDFFQNLHDICNQYQQNN